MAEKMAEKMAVKKNEGDAVQRSSSAPSTPTRRTLSLDAEAEGGGAGGRLTELFDQQNTGLMQEFNKNCIHKEDIPKMDS